MPLPPPEKCVRAKVDKYIEWIIAHIVCKHFKDIMQTIIITPKGFTKMPTPDMWENLRKRDF